MLGLSKQNKTGQDHNAFVAAEKLSKTPKKGFNNTDFASVCVIVSFGFKDGEL